MRATRVCSVEGCDGKHRCSGYCERHYRKFMRDGTPDGIASRQPRPDHCTAADCARPVIAKGLCAAHYQQAKKGKEPGTIYEGGPSPVVIDGDAAWVILRDRRGQERARTAIDVADVPVVSLHCWRVTRGGDKDAKPYVVSHTGGLLHRLLMSPPDEMEVDHIDRDGLNNRRANLRVVTRAENAQNVRRDKRNLPRGVSISRKCTLRPYLATVVIGGRTVQGGHHATPEAAAESAARLRRELHTHAME